MYYGEPGTRQRTSLDQDGAPARPTPAESYQSVAMIDGWSAKFLRHMVYTLLVATVVNMVLLVLILLSIWCLVIVGYSQSDEIIDSVKESTLGSVLALIDVFSQRAQCVLNKFEVGPCVNITEMVYEEFWVDARPLCTDGGEIMEECHVFDDVSTSDFTFTTTSTRTFDSSSFTRTSTSDIIYEGVDDDHDHHGAHKAVGTQSRKGKAKGTR